MISTSQLPALNATLNAASAVFLALGYNFIRQKRVAAHRACMLVAVAVSVVFLISYVTYHVQVGSKHFPGHGLARPAYFTILLTHTVLAMVVALYLAPVTLIRALRERFECAKSDNDLPKDTDAAALARYLMAVSNGMCIHAAAGASRKELRQTAEYALAAWPVKAVQKPKKRTVRPREKVS